LARTSRSGRYYEQKQKARRVGAISCVLYRTSHEEVQPVRTERFRKYLGNSERKRSAIISHASHKSGGGRVRDLKKTNRITKYQRTGTDMGAIRDETANPYGRQGEKLC